MGSIHNTRILRFLIVLGAVILTIFIYASYSTNTSLAPLPHMRTASAPPAAAALNGERRTSLHSVTNKSLEADAVSDGGGEEILLNIARANIVNKVNKKHASAPAQLAANNGIVLAKKPHHREPTIDVDAGGGGAGGVADGAAVPGGMDELGDEAALETFGNADLLEEQYIQNVVDNTLGNINNSVAALGAAQAQQQQPQISSQQQQQQQNAVVDNTNNLNKILDSDVLIPTSNLQKFIENADKILKNITSPPAAPALVPKSSEKDTLSLPAAAEKPSPDQLPSNLAANAPLPANDAADNDEALPPSVIMTIKSAGGGSAGKPLIAAKTNTPSKPKVAGPSKSNATVASGPVDPTQGIQTQRIYESGHMNEEINIEKLCPNGGADLKLLVLITSAQAHAEARLAIRQTWAHYGTRRDVSTAFVLGRSTNETQNLALTQENFIYGDLIRGHFIDSYNNLTLKTISSLEWVDEHCARAKYVLKTDDDMFINVPKLLAFLDSHAKEKRVIYGRLAKKWKPIRNKKSKYYVSTGQFGAPVFPPFTTGPAYVMTSDIVHELYIRSLHQVYLKLEDVFTTGIVAQQLNIKRVHVNEFLNRRIAFNPCSIRKTISVHMIKANEQFDLWKKLLDQTTKCK